jgi:ubiquinone/menaquinone biosynthesis C-methylase UbiE
MSDSLAKIYDGYAGAGNTPYDIVLLNSDCYRNSLADAVARLSSGEHFLDAGTGTANFAIGIADAKVTDDWRMEGIDTHEGMLAVARKKLAERGLQDRVTLQEGSVAKLPYDDGSFDGIACLNVLYQLPDYHAALAELARVAALGAEIVVTGPNLQNDIDQFLKLNVTEYKRKGIWHDIKKDAEGAFAANKELSGLMTLRSAEQVAQDLEAAGFEILNKSETHYFGMQHFVHARKIENN